MLETKEGAKKHMETDSFWKLKIFLRDKVILLKTELTEIYIKKVWSSNGAGL